MPDRHGSLFGRTPLGTSISGAWPTICLHRTRQGFVTERTATYKRLRGLLSEIGIVLPQKVTGLRTSIGKHLDALPGYAKRCIADLREHRSFLLLSDDLSEYGSP